MADIAKLLIISGLALIFVGAMAMFLSKIPGLGRLPGDIFIQKGNNTFYFPIVTCIIISIILTIILNLWPKK